MNSYASIPQPLKDLPNWVNWKLETRDGKITKVPYNAKTGRKAKANDPATWATFDQANDASADILNGYDGVGFELHGTPFVGIDFDGAIRDGVPDPFVLEVLKHLGNPYCEVSPSGTGLHAFVECYTLPAGGRKMSKDKNGAEVYSGSEGGRYFTMTGEKFSGDGIPKIDDICLPYFLLSQARNTKFKSLWMGDTSAYDNDDSAADLALVSILARLLGGDRVRVEKYFGASRLARPEKWFKREDYRRMTLDKALGKARPTNASQQTAEDFVESGTSPTSSEIISVMACDVVPVPIEFLWEPYLQQSALNAYYGNPSVGKGHIAMDNIACLTTGRPFPEESSTDRKPMTCVILAAEEGVEDTIVPRLNAAGADLTRVRIVKSIRYHKKGDKIEDRLITFQTDMVALKEDLAKHSEEHFLLVDPITNYVGDINFNQDGEVRPVLTLLVQLAEELKITVLIVGHFNKNTNVGSALDKPGGGRAWTAVPRSVWGFFRHRDNKQQRVMVNLKLNNAKESETGLLFTIGDRVIGTKPNGKPWTVGYVEWGDKTDMSADEMVAAEHPEARRDSKGTDFLNASLKSEVRKATDVYTEAKAASIHERTLKRACADIGVLKFKMHDGWYWQHPSDMTPIPDSARELNKEAQVRRETQKPVPPEPEPEFSFTEVRVG